MNWLEILGLIFAIGIFLSIIAFIFAAKNATPLDHDLPYPEEIVHDRALNDTKEPEDSPVNETEIDSGHMIFP